MSKQIKNNGYMLGCFLLATTIILLRSYLASDGYLTADGCHYLSLAQTLLNKFSFMVNSPAGREERVFFAVWPIGYPFLIYLMAKLTGFSVFLASKLLNITLMAVLVMTFAKTFKNDALLYTPIILLAPFIENFTYSLSEVPFILGMFFFSLALHRAIQHPRMGGVDVILIFLACQWLFFSRYIGLFVLGILGLFFVYFLSTRQWRKMLLFGLTLILCLLSILSYFYFNFKTTGYITGMPRGSLPFQEFETFIFMISRGLLAEINLLVLGFGPTPLSFSVFILTFAAQFLLLYRLFQKERFPFSLNQRNLLSAGGLFIFVGIFYLMSIISARTISYFGVLNFRYLFPGTFMIIIGIITLLKQHIILQQKKTLFSTFLLIALLSSAINIILPAIKQLRNPSLPQGYQQTMETLLQKVVNIPPGSVIIFGDRNLAYLRPDLSIASPFYIPNFPQKETWHDFLQRIANKYGNKEVYVMLGNSNFFESVNEQDLVQIYDTSVVTFILEHLNNRIFKLNNHRIP